MHKGVDCGGVACGASVDIRTVGCLKWQMAHGRVCKGLPPWPLARRLLHAVPRHATYTTETSHGVEMGQQLLHGSWQRASPQGPLFKPKWKPNPNPNPNPNP